MLLLLLLLLHGMPWSKNCSTIPWSIIKVPVFVVRSAGVDVVTAEGILEQSVTWAVPVEQPRNAFRCCSQVFAQQELMTNMRPKSFRCTKIMFTWAQVASINPCFYFLFFVSYLHPTRIVRTPVKPQSWQAALWLAWHCGKHQVETNISLWWFAFLCLLDLHFILEGPGFALARWVVTTKTLLYDPPDVFMKTYNLMRQHEFHPDKLDECSLNLWVNTN